MKNWKEKIFEEKMTPVIDRIYRFVFDKKIRHISRSSRENNTDKRTLFMDMELAIDTHLTFDDGSVLTAQEKTLRATKRSFQQFTFEYYNDPVTKDPGEWFKLGAQIYFFGYANEKEDCYSQFFILDIAKLRIGLIRIGIDEIIKKYIHVNKPPAKASFFGIPFKIIREIPGCVIKEWPEIKGVLPSGPNPINKA